MRIVIIALFTVLSNQSTSQQSPESIALLLSGSKHKEWIASPWKNVMGADTKKKCTGGESYIFYKDSAVEIRKCADGTVTKKSFNWKISKEGQDNILHLGDIRYQIRVKKGTHSEVKLRTLVYDKGTMSEEVILKHEKY